MRHQTLSLFKMRHQTLSPYHQALQMFVLNLSTGVKQEKAVVNRSLNSCGRLRSNWQADIRSIKYQEPCVSRALRLNYTELKNHIQGRVWKQAIKPVQSTAFIELDCGHPFFESECIVEMDNKDGSKMKWYFKGRTDLDFLELGKAFWSKGS